MKKLLTFLFLTSTIITYSQKKIVFKAKVSPNKTYLTTLKTSSRNELDFIADQEIIDRIKKKGIELPMITESETDMAVDIVTSNRNKNGEFSAKMQYGKITSTTTQNGETKTENKPYSGMEIIGKYDSKNKFKVDSITGGNQSEQMKKDLIAMLENVQQSVKFPKKSMKIGDSFKNDLPLTIPVENMNPIYIKITIEYTLTRIEGNIAFFDLKQNIGLDISQEQINVNADGEGTGVAEYNIQEHYLTKNASEIAMNMTVKINEKATMKIKTLIKSEQNVVIQ
jgi:hypothetical protein